MDETSPQNITRRAGRNLGATILVLLMIVAALSMWTAVPLGWVWIGSQISEGQAPSGGPYMVVLFGIVTSILIISWVLSRLNQAYVHLTGSRTVEAIRPAWLKSLRDSEAPRAYPTVLETVIVTSVVLAIISMTVWFFVAAGSPLPSQ
ncbi:MAG: hypothetical protein ACRDKV_10430 [Solirubrobacterales bacterium]